jgi:dCMP deaminase
MNDLERAYFKDAYRVASQLSTDPSTQNGAVLVDANGDVVAWGANHFPYGVQETEERWRRPQKYKYVEHAERNAIYHAAERGIATRGLVMYCPWAACSDCSRAIIQSGIKEVVTHYDPCAAERFGQPASIMWLEEIKIAVEMFKEAGVNFRWVTDVIDEYDIRFNGKVVRP